MPLYKTEGIVLRKQEFGETDEIISLLSPDFGNKKIMVKGVRKALGSRVGKFELFADLRVMLATGRTFDIVSQVEVISSHPRLREDLVRMTYGLYLLELFDGLLFFSEPHSGYFYLLRDSLSVLERADTFESLNLFVMISLLRMLGYQPSVPECPQCGRSREEGYFSAMAGGIVCGRCARGERATLKVERDVCQILERLPGLTLRDITSGSIDEGTACRARHVMEYYILQSFSKQLRVSRLIGQVKALEGRTGIG